MKFQNDLNLRCHSVLAKVDYADLTGLVASQGPSANLPSTRRFAPNPAFIPQDRPKSWYTTASDTITDTEVKVISEWLESGGTYTFYTDPARRVKLLLV